MPVAKLVPVARKTGGCRGSEREAAEGRMHLVLG